MQTAETTLKEKNLATLEEGSGGIRGRITMDQNVVATIAGLAASEIAGIHSLGKPRLISFGNDPARGVEAEVGNEQAALDLDVVIEYGCDILAVSQALREAIASRVRKMAGREVVEVNVHVVDIKLPEHRKQTTREEPRVI